MVDDFSKAKLHITILPDAEYILLNILANMARHQVEPILQATASSLHPADLHWMCGL